MVKFCLLTLHQLSNFVLLSPQERIRLARQVEKAEYRNFQACLHNSWIEQAAAALEIELDEEMYKGAPGCGGGSGVEGRIQCLFSLWLSLGWDHPLLWSRQGQQGPFSCLMATQARCLGPFLSVWLCLLQQPSETMCGSRSRAGCPCYCSCSLTVISLSAALSLPIRLVMNSDCLA